MFSHGSLPFLSLTVMSRNIQNRRGSRFTVRADAVHYSVLRVSEYSTLSELKSVICSSLLLFKAYRRRALSYHPDANKDPGAEAKFIEITNAYEVLIDEMKSPHEDGVENAEMLHIKRTCYDWYSLKTLKAKCTTCGGQDHVYTSVKTPLGVKQEPMTCSSCNGTGHVLTFLPNQELVVDGVNGNGSISPATEEVIELDEVGDAISPAEVEVEEVNIWGQIKEIVMFTGPAAGLWLCGPLMSLIDTAVIGQGSSLELVALGPATVVCDYLCYTFMFLSVTTSNLVATAPARQDKDEVQHQISILLFIGLACGVMMMGFTRLFGSWALTGAKNAEIVPTANTYVQIRGLAWPAVLIGWVAQSARLGMKDSWGPLKALAVASAVNGVGDVVLCIFLGYGIAGAAWATMVSQMTRAETSSSLENEFCLTNPSSVLRPSTQEEKLHRKLPCGRLCSQANQELDRCLIFIHLSFLAPPPAVNTSSASVAPISFNNL
ncbi:unnamed protein product [Arabidopsis halleri]